MGGPPQQITVLLARWRSGDHAALDALIPQVYEELRKIARRFLVAERPGHTLQSTALVNEAYMRLVGQNQIEWKNRAHFLGVAATLIRNILVDHARGRAARKRGAGANVLSLDMAIATGQERQVDLLALDDALQSLHSIDPQQSRIVELRFFAGLSIEETAEVVGVSISTIKREWALARAFLFRQIAWRGRGA